MMQVLSPRWLAGAQKSCNVFRLAAASWSSQPEIQQNQEPEVTISNSSDDPLKHEDFFGVKNLVSVKDLFDARMHFGHKSGCRNRLMTPYLFGQRLGVDIFDLDKSLPLLHTALNFTAHVAYRGGIIMFVSRNKQNLPLIEKTAFDCGEYSHCRRWIKGSFTNASVQYGSTVRLPNLCIFINTLDTIFLQHHGVIECAKLLIPTIGIVDSNCDPRLITYPVPGNDDTPCSVELYCELFKKAILLGKEKKKASRAQKTLPVEGQDSQKDL